MVKILPQSHLHCLERGAHVMRMSHRMPPHADTGHVIADATHEDLLMIAADGGILGDMINRRFLDGDTPEQVRDWMVANGVRKHFADMWLNRSPLAWHYPPSEE